MFGKILGFVGCLALLSCSHVIASSDGPITVPPLQTTIEADELVKRIYLEGMDSGPVLEILNVTITSATKENYLSKVEVLRYVLGNIVGTAPAISSTIISGISGIIKEHYEGPYTKQGYDMQYADVVWRLQTTGYNGDEIKVGYSGIAIKEVIEILQGQKNGNKPKAEEFLEHIKETLGGKKIDTRQFGLS